MSGFANRGPQDNTATSTYAPGPQLFDPSVAATGGGRSYATVAAKAGGTRAAATPLTAAINRITPCATAADSVCLPPAVGGQVVYVQNAGMRHAPPEVMQKLLAGQPVDPALVYFRTIPKFETSAPELQWLTRAVFVGTGERYPTEVVVRFWRVE